MGDPLVREAAAISNRFHIDPITVLDATREEALIRLAALLIVHDEEKKAVERERARSRR